MKVLVAAPHICDCHRPEPTDYDELVVMLSCVECDKEQTMFMGLETGDLINGGRPRVANDHFQSQGPLMH